MAQAVARAKSAKSAKTSMYRGLVLSAAERLFATRGYDQTKIQDIAAASGLSLGTLYSVFEGKADIFEAIHDDRLTELFSIAGDAVGSDAPALQRLFEGNRVFVRWLTEHPDFLKIHLESSAWASHPTDVSEGQTTAWRRGIDLIASVLEKAMQEGEAHPGDPVIAARLMVSIQQVFMSAWVEDRMNEEPEALALRIEEQLRRSLARSHQ